MSADEAVDVSAGLLSFPSWEGIYGPPLTSSLPAMGGCWPLGDTERPSMEGCWSLLEAQGGRHGRLSALWRSSKARHERLSTLSVL